MKEKLIILLVMLGLVFANGVYAQDEETPTDTTADEPTDEVTTEPITLTVDGTNYAVDAQQTLTVEVNGEDTVDVYLAMVHSSGSFACLTVGESVQFENQNVVSPILSSWTIVAEEYPVEVSLAGLPEGDYTWYGILCQEGADPLDSTNWTASSTIEFTIGSSVTNMPEMVEIPAGTFLMGDTTDVGISDELPVHSVTVDSFYMGKYEVTNEQFCEFLNDGNDEYYSEHMSSELYGGIDKYEEDIEDDAEDTEDAEDADSEEEEIIDIYTPKKGKENHPVIFVDWHTAVAYCEWLSANTGLNYRLPTEAEWEYACRAGTLSTYSFGEDIDSTCANYDNDQEGTTEAGSYPANFFGLYDMHGNVWEWCWDWYDNDSYEDSPSTNPSGPESGTRKVLRGGSWASLYDRSMSSSYRYYTSPNTGLNTIGFRVVLSSIVLDDDEEEDESTDE